MPRIIDEVTWQRVQKKMGSNKRGEASAQENCLLSGLARCGKCEGAMVGNRRPGGTKGLYISYECLTRKRTKQCDMKSVAKHVIEGVVIDYLRDQLFSPNGIEQLAKRIIQLAGQRNQGISKDIRALEAQLQGVQAEINNIVDAIAQGMFQRAIKESA
jgi:site-specific DNA recombinase